jgi:hypothetical protein
MMNLISIVGTEFVSLVGLAAQVDEQFVVIGYLAFGCISEIDELYYNIVNSTLKAELEEIEYKLPIIYEKSVLKEHHKEVGCCAKFNFAMTWLLQ